MAEGYLAWNILFLQEKVRRLERKVERRLLRDAQNPFDLPQQEFIAQFRLTQDFII